jgi:hypothetical protein
MRVPATTQKTPSTLLSLLLIALCAGPLSAEIVTGDPATDGWTEGGQSTAAIVFSNASYDVTTYTTAFALDPASNLLSASIAQSLGWSAGDTIIGVGGVFTPTGNSSLTYESSNNYAANLHLVVKYGTGTASWILGNSSSEASLNNGGSGAVLLATGAGTFSSLNSGTPEVTSDAPTEYNGSMQVDLSTGDFGQQVTYWTGSGATSQLVGFETFLDLTLLDADAGAQSVTPEVALGDKYILDLQQGNSVLQDSLGTLPSSLEPSETPEPATGVLLLGGILVALFLRRRTVGIPVR